MKIRFPWQKDSVGRKLSSVESFLDKKLTPVKPRTNFVSDLRYQLVGLEQKKAIAIPAKTIQSGLVIAGAALSVFFVLVTGIRALVSLLAALGLIHQVNKQMDNANPVISHPAV
ncbi:MAG: hypothetical protein OEZ02_09835 [Anaerolineae bacterium]|nr:hypothetical protein [Anaerolineae bacterium]